MRFPPLLILCLSAKIVATSAFVMAPSFVSTQRRVQISELITRQRMRPTFTRHKMMPGISEAAGSFIEALGDGIFTSILPAFPSTLSLAQVQTAGETSLAALLSISAIQGSLIGHQYATNPAGELIVPPGLTFGIEEDDGEQETDFDTQAQRTSQSSQLAPTSPAALEDTKCNAKKGWYQVNKMIVFLLPWLARGFSFVQLGHLMHFSVIMGLAKFYDFFSNVPPLDAPDTRPLFSEKPKILVLGDSMSVGIGAVQEFDPDKNSGILRRIEQLEPNENDQDATGPVFPRVLAHTLAKDLHRPVAWRSAGVDGGDTHDIREHLLGVVQEEVDKGAAPDVVVVLTGSNDLKHILDPKRGASVRGFRSNLLQLVHDIRAISPHTKVVFPALPTYRLDANSVLNVFPLVLFLDTLIGIWDIQKQRAAEHSPGTVYYYGLSVQEVNSWYQEGQTASLVAADGIHPNAECYAKWASYLGHELAKTCQQTSCQLEGNPNHEVGCLDPIPA